MCRFRALLHSPVHLRASRCALYARQMGTHDPDQSHGALRGARPPSVIDSRPRLPPEEAARLLLKQRRQAFEQKLAARAASFEKRQARLKHEKHKRATEKARRALEGRRKVALYNAERRAKMIHAGERMNASLQHEREQYEREFSEEHACDRSRFLEKEAECQRLRAELIMRRDELHVMRASRLKSRYPTAYTHSIMASTRRIDSLDSTVCSLLGL